MHQNLNPKERKNAARVSKPEISEMVSSQRHLGAGGCQLFFGLAHSCSLLLTLAHCTSPVKKPRLKRVWDAVDGCNRREMAFTNFLGKNHKSIGQKAGRWQGMIGAASIHHPLSNALITTRLLAQFEQINILLPRCFTIIFSEISFPQGRTG